MLDFSRRDIFGLTAAALTAPKITAKRSLKVAYLTDIHLPDDAAITERAKRAVQKAQNCDLVLFGGDNLMAIDHKPADQIAAQLKNWEKNIQPLLKKPSLAILGNHDVEQWQSDDASPMNGKRNAIKLFGMENRFWSKTLKGWRFMGLDTVHRYENSYMGHLDPEQLEWLDRELKDTKTPTVVLGHIPILTVTSLANSGLQPKDRALPVGFGVNVANHQEALKRFRKAGNVKLALSGHTHMQDIIAYAGTTYMCAGAVCGGWWNGDNEGFGPTYVELELFDDGTFKQKFVGWED